MAYKKAQEDKLARIARQENPASAEKRQKKQAAALAEPPPPVPSAAAGNSKVSFKLKYEYEQLPQKIKQLEEDCAAMEKQLSDGEFYRREPDEFYAVSERFTRAKAALDKAETRWLELEEICGGQI